MILRKTILEGTRAVHLGVRLCLPFAKGAHPHVPQITGVHHAHSHGDGTNDVGVLEYAHIVVVLLNDIPDDLKRDAEHQRIKCLTKAYGTQL